MSDRVYTDPKGNQRDRVLAILRDRANDKGYVKDADVALIARLTGIPEHDVAKHLWGMQKMGLIGFSTRHVHGKTVPFRFRLTAKARDTAPEPTGRPEGAVGFPAGIQVPGETEGPKSGRCVECDTGERAHGTMDHPFTPVQEIAAVIPVPQEVLDDAASIMDARPPAFTAEAYPEIFALIERETKREKIEEAARALEQAGLDDLAVQALESIPPITALETEVRALIRIYWRKDWEQPGASLRETITGLRGDSTFDED